MEDWADKELDRFLKPTENHWQPNDFLPDSQSPDFLDQVRTAALVGGVRVALGWGWRCAQRTWA